jgi:energy-coupling factor transporter ATP-binding protein EcfA2
MILEKALTLQLAHFEDSEFYDKLTQARREASSRPLSLVNRTFGLVQNAVSLSSYAVLLFAFSPWAVLILIGAGLPSFFAEAKFSGDAFRLFRWRSPDTRMQIYLESVIAREDGVKEVKLFQLGPSTTAFYGAYAWIVITTINGEITLGAMTMYLVLFRQGQAAVAAILSSISGMYEDNLYLSNLYEYLGQPVPGRHGDATFGPDPSRGIEFKNVSFAYAGSSHKALTNISLQIRPGESLALVGENGSGKTTLIKLLTRLYEPTEGCICITGTSKRCVSALALSFRISAVTSFLLVKISAQAMCGISMTLNAGQVRRRPGWRHHLSRTCRKAMKRNLGAGSKAGVSCRVGSGRRSHYREHSCVAMPIYWYSTSQLPQWMPHQRRRYSITSARRAITR